jgi:hypothetical protein
LNGTFPPPDTVPGLSGMIDLRHASAVFIAIRCLIQTIPESRKGTGDK